MSDPAGSPSHTREGEFEEECPVCVFSVSNLPLSELYGLVCWNCGSEFLDGSGLEG